MQRLMTLVVACVAALWCLPAHAQLHSRAFRLSLDTDMIGIAGVNTDHSGDYMTFGFGPNHVGSQQRVGAPPLSTLGLGLGWALSQKMVLGVRTGFGFDVIKVDGDDENTKLLGVSLMPYLMFVPIGRRAKLFLNASPIFQVNRLKYDERKDRYLLGGFALGIGALIFAGSSCSVDLGFHFEGRFGNRRWEDDNDNGDTTDHYKILQGVVRLGLSLWT